MVQKYKETKKRTMVKALFLRVIVFSIITGMVYLLFGSIEEGIEVALLDIVIELIVHYVYERTWQNIGWGIIIKKENDPAKTYPVITIPPIEEDSEDSEDPEIVEIQIIDENETN